MSNGSSPSCYGLPPPGPNRPRRGADRGGSQPIRPWDHGQCRAHHCKRDIHMRALLERDRTCLWPSLCHQAGRVAGHAGGISQANLSRSVLEETLQIRAALDDGSRPLLQLAVDPLKERSADIHMRALLERDFVRKVAQLRMPVRDLLDLLAQERVLLSQLVVHHGRFLTTLLGLVRQPSPRAVSRSAGLTRARFRGWPGVPVKLQPRAAHLVPRLMPSHAV